MSKRIDFCTNCRKECEYILKKSKIKKYIREKEYEFEITVAICKECGKEIDIPGLLDRNIKEVDTQFRYKEGIVSIDGIKKMMEIYKIGKAPLSYALGFGEITITRYLDGQIPSKEYSDIIKNALLSPHFMKEKLYENKEKIADTAYKKAYNAATNIENLFNVSEVMLKVISYIFRKTEEVTPLMLQKILYYIQGINLALYEEEMFPEECRAWLHGPVYKDVYNLFRDFKYNPIDDARFTIFDNSDVNLSSKEKNVIELVVNTFGMYSGKTLEKITHKEEPWIKAREGYGEGIPSDELITTDSMKDYFKKVNKKFNLSREDEVRKYIINMFAFMP